MPAKNPRVNVVLETSLYEALGKVARHDGTSLSTAARDLLRDALVLREDAGLYDIAQERSATSGVTLSHAAVWSTRTAKRRRVR